MGAITRSIANNITTSGVFTSSAITNNSVTGITVLPNAEDGITFISSQTASNSASISFTSGLTSTYKAYKFVFVNMKSSNAQNMEMNFSTDSGSNYNVTKTTTTFVSEHSEDDSSVARIAYADGYDIAQGTGFQTIFNINKGGLDSGADASASGEMTLFNPSSTTYVKHFIGRFNSMSEYPGSTDNYVAGYCNTTSAVNAVRFRVVNSTGNISGTIYLYGIK